MQAIAFTISGFFLFLVGIALIYWPAALIVAGVCMATLGLFAVGIGNES